MKGVKAFAHHSNCQPRIRKHTGEEQYEYDQCCNAFVSHSNLQKHKKNTEEKPSECNHWLNICMYQTSSNL